MSDYDTLLSMWNEPRINLTLWRHLIEDIFRDDVRYQNFRDECKKKKKVSPVHRAFDLELKLDFNSSDEYKYLRKISECFNQMADHYSIQCLKAKAYLNVLHFERSKDNTSEEDFREGDIFQYNVELLRKITHDGYKKSYIYLISSEVLVRWDSDDPTFPIPNEQSLHDDPYFALIYYTYRLRQNWDLYARIIEIILHLNRPLDEKVIESSLIVIKIYQYQRTRDLDPMWHQSFIQLFEHLEPHFHRTRLLPKERDPYSVYFSELDPKSQNIFTQARNLYQQLKN